MEKKTILIIGLIIAVIVLGSISFAALFPVQAAGIAQAAGTFFTVTLGNILRAPLAFGLYYAEWSVYAFYAIEIALVLILSLVIWKVAIGKLVAHIKGEAKPAVTYNNAPIVQQPASAPINTVPIITPQKEEVKQ